MPDQNLAAAVEVLVGGASGTFLVCSGANALVSQKTASEVRTLLSVLTSAQIAAAYQPLGSYASSVHTHAQSDISGLVSALAAKASTSHKAEHVVGGSDAFTAADIRGVLGVTTLSGSNTGDQDLSSYLTAATATATYAPIAAGQPTAGTVGQVLAKNSGTNYDSSWTTLVPGDRYLTTSTTSNTLSNTVKSFTIGTGLAYTPTQNITIAYDASNHMHGEVVTYNSGTGALSVDIKNHTGAGTYVAWVVNVGGIAPATVVSWGDIIGTLGLQSDLATALNGKLEVTTAATTYQPLDSNLTAIAALSPANDDFVQRKAGVWTNRTVAQVKTDLSLTGTNSGDQTITLTGNVTGSGTGSFATTIASLAVTNAMLAGSIAISKLSITGTPDATKFLRDDGSWQPQISSFNASTAASQTFAIGAEPSAAPDVVMTTNITTGENLLYIPSAGATTRGLVTTGTQTFAGAKTFSTSATVPNGTSLAPKLNFASDSTSGLFYNPTGAIYVGVAVGGALSAKFDALGNFSMDGTDPTITVGQSGPKIRVSGTYFYLTQADGTTAARLDVGALNASGAISGSNLSGTNTGDQTITLTGGVTGSGTGSFAATVVTNANLTGDVTSVGNAATIATAAITLAKMANVATGTVFYRKTAATGVPEVQTLATLKTDLGLTGTNSGDQTITLTGGVTGSGTGSFAATVVTNANLTGHVTSVGNAAVLGSFTKAQLNTAVSDGDVVYLDSVDTITGVKTMSGLNVILVSSSGLTIRNPANTFKYTITAGAIAADRVLTLPLTAGTLALTSDITGTNSGTNTGDQTITLTGDVTGSGTGSFAATIATAAVSLAKMANVATGTVFYRKTAATGVPEVQTLATLKTDLGLTGTNSGDQDLSSYLTSATAASTYVPVTRTLNALALSADQTFAVASTGTDFAVTSTGTTHTFAIPTASATARGLVSTGVQTIAGVKTFTSSLTYSVDGGALSQTYKCYNPSTSAGTQFLCQRARGSAATPLYPASGDVLFGLYGYGWDENLAGFSLQAHCICSASAAWTTTPDISQGTQWTWGTTDPLDIATVNTNRMRLHGDGSLTIGGITQSGGLLELVKSNTGLTGFGTALNRMRFSDSDTTTANSQPIGEIEFYSYDATAPGAGVKGSFACIAESATPAAAFVWGLDTTTGAVSEVMRLTSTGRLGLGTGTTISAFLHVISTSLQMRVGYDVSNYYTTTVSSAGAITFDAVGASAGFTFSDAVTLSSTSTATGLLTTTAGIKTTKTIYQTTETTSTPAAGAVTIDLTLNNHQTLSLTSLAAAGTSQVTFTPPTGSSAGTLIVKQHATASKDITTWAVTGGTIKWMGTEPNWVGDAATNLRVVSWRWDGSIMYLAATDVGT